VMDSMWAFVKVWIRGGMVLWRRADPLLMGAAIAFNGLFAAVPLAVAFVSFLTLLDRPADAMGNLTELLLTLLPADIAIFIIDVVNESFAFVDADRTLIAVVSILIALWSGSRAVYAIQKALRLVQGVADDRGYIRTRLTGIIVTVGAGVAVFVAYGALLIGENAWQQLSEWLGLPNVGMTQALLTAVALLWIFGLLWVIYRFGPPAPVDHAVIVAGGVTTVLAIGTVIAAQIVPSLGSEAIAVFGSLGVILLWLYYVGVVVIALPIASISFTDAMQRRTSG